MHLDAVKGEQHLEGQIFARVFFELGPQPLVARVAVAEIKPAAGEPWTLACTHLTYSIWRCRRSFTSSDIWQKREA